MSQGRRLSADLKETLEFVAPGTEIRAAIENVILAGNGGLMVFADPAELGGRVVSGGMRLGCDLTPMRLYELSKMDGAIVVSPDLSTIHRANAQLTPDPDIPSQETGLRHLAAHRTACQTGARAIAISNRRKVVTLYPGEHRPRVLDPVGVVLGKAGSAIVTLEKFARRLREQTRLLSVHEYEGTATLAEVVGVLTTFEYTAHIAERVEDYVAELGTEGNLIALQLEQATHWIPTQHEALVRDYVPKDVSHEEARRRLQDLTTSRLSDAPRLAKALGYSRAEFSEDPPLSPRGYRQLAQLPRIPGKIRAQLVEHFGSLDSLTRAPEQELSRVHGVGKARARAITRGLHRSRELGPPAELS
ncbi:MAG: DNA integrity scanning diadenylate cyclase DisA [Actinomycetota bacterium]|nr:DNA integrity scanning diadenylate cyclase DisA [Actinomycetota bacterium]